MIEELNSNWDVGPMSYPFGNGINISMSVSDVDLLYRKVYDLNIKKKI